MPFHRWTLAEEFAGCLLSDVCFSAGATGERCTAEANAIEIKAQRGAARRRMCFSAFCSQKWQQIKGNAGLHHAADLRLARTRACSLHGFGASRALLVKPHPEHQAWKGCCSQKRLLQLLLKQFLFNRMKMKLEPSREGQEIFTADLSRQNTMSLGDNVIFFSQWKTPIPSTETRSSHEVLPSRHSEERNVFSIKQSAQSG